MTGSDLAKALASLRLSQADFARLVDVTPRGVQLWLNGQRGIPAAASAYLNLLLTLPPAAREVEINRARTGGRPMKDGMYQIEYATASDEGKGMLIFDNGRVYGADFGGGLYDGSATPSSTTGMVDLALKITLKAERHSIFGITKPYDWSFEINAVLDPSRESDIISVASELGQGLRAKYDYLRPLPRE